LAIVEAEFLSDKIVVVVVDSPLPNFLLNCLPDWIYFLTV
jgi:hypothetical protein